VLVLFYAFAVTGFQNWVTPLFALPYYLVGCYIITIVLALPLYLALSHFFRATLAWCLFFGFVIGFLVPFVPFVLQAAGKWPMYDSYRQGREMLIVNGHFTGAGIRNGFVSSGEIGLFGAAIALMFWIVAFWRSPDAVQNRRDIPK